VAERHVGADRKAINLALQGGGAHGAFAWGALDRILEDDRIVIEGIVGTSAGAMNAVVTAYGLTLGGNEGARLSLRSFWEAVSEKGACSIMQPSWIDRMISPGSLDYSPGWIMMDTLSRVWSPYQMNPTNYHPLRDILNEQIDFDLLRQSDKVKLFVCASNVLTNRLHVFKLRDMSVDAVVASGCIPSVFQARGLYGEPTDLPHHLRLRHERPAPHHGEPDPHRTGATNRASDPRSHQYAELQLELDAGDARDQLRQPPG
jgi:NTE family protein